MTLDEIVRDRKAYENSLKIALAMKWEITVADLEPIVRILRVIEVNELRARRAAEERNYA